MKFVKKSVVIRLLMFDLREHILGTAQKLHHIHGPERKTATGERDLKSRKN